MRAGREGFRTPPEMDSPDDLELEPLLRGGPSSPSRSELPETPSEETNRNVSGNDDALCPIENPSIDHAHTQELLWMAACVDLITNLAISAPYPFLPQLLERSGTGPYRSDACSRRCRWAFCSCLPTSQKSCGASARVRF